MRRRQTAPRQWLILTAEDDIVDRALRSLPRRSGVLLLFSPSSPSSRALRQLARQRELIVAREGPRTATRVHDVVELRRALQAKTPLILLSPLFETATHPDWQAIPRMRAATMARLARGRLVALGGMNARRWAQIERLGFQAWAGISAFRT